MKVLDFSESCWGHSLYEISRSGTTRHCHGCTPRAPEVNDFIVKDKWIYRVTEANRCRNPRDAFSLKMQILPIVRADINHRITAQQIIDGLEYAKKSNAK